MKFKSVCGFFSGKVCFFGSNRIWDSSSLILSNGVFGTKDQFVNVLMATITNFLSN